MEIDEVYTMLKAGRAVTRDKWVIDGDVVKYLVTVTLKDGSRVLLAHYKPFSASEAFVCGHHFTQEDFFANDYRIVEEEGGENE
jgi:hypothetical protein